jgi:hypothetical protein
MPQLGDRTLSRCVDGDRFDEDQSTTAVYYQERPFIEGPLGPEAHTELRAKEVSYAHHVQDVIERGVGPASSATSTREPPLSPSSRPRGRPTSGNGRWDR